MTFDIRTLTEGDKDSYDELRRLSLFSHPTPEQRELTWSTRDVERMLGVFEGDRLVGAAATYGFTMSVPGGEVATTGVAGVGVLPSHTRRGGLRQLMAAVFDLARDKGEPVSCLWASEPGIYGRFGYGIGTAGMHWTLPRADGAFLPEISVDGAVHVAARPDADAMAPVFDRLVESVPGVIRRSPAWWARRLHDPDGKLMMAHTEGGYALYRIDGGWSDRGPDYTLVAYEVIAPEPAAYARLWRYLLDVDLVANISAGHRPMDDQIQWMLVSPRSMQRRLGEGMWVRLLDLPAALSARTYSAPVDVVIEVADDAVPANSGRWRIAVAEEDGKAVVERADSSPPDLSIGPAALGAAYLGGTRVLNLLRAGRVDEHRPGAAVAVDRAFAASPAPWAVTWF